MSLIHKGYSIKVKFIFVAVALIALLFLGFNSKKNSEINNYLVSKTAEFETMYLNNYDQFKKRSAIMFNLLVNRDDVIEIYKELQDANSTKKDKLREKLYETLNKNYRRLEFTKLKQLHFHLVSNESFLRFHKPEKHGDDLSDFRESVKFVNEKNQKIDGFEAGKLVSGYRFVYPIQSSDKKHLGSVEISYSVDAFTRDFMNSFHVLSTFCIKKSVIDNKVWSQYLDANYMQSNIDGYYIEKGTYLEFMAHINKNLKDVAIPKNIANKAVKKLSSGKNFTLYDSSTNMTVTFIPVRNAVTKSVVAFFIIKSADIYIKKKLEDFYFIIFLFSLFISILTYLIYLREKNKADENERLENEVELKTLELKNNNERINLILNSQSSMVIVSNGQRASSVNREFLKSFGYLDLDDFNLNHSCVCELFIDKVGVDHLMPTMDGVNWTDYIHNHPDKLHVAYIKNRFNEEKIYSVKVNSKAFKEDSEKIIVFNDITELLHLQNDLEDMVDEKTKELTQESETLKNLEEYEKTVIESNTNAIIAMDYTFKITTYNAKAQEMFGWSKDEMLGSRNIFKIVPDEYKDKHKKAAIKYIKTGKSSGVIGKTHEFEGLKKDGTIFPISISIGANWRESGAIVVANIADMSEKKDVEKRLKELNETLQQRVNSAVKKLEDEQSRHEQSLVESTKFTIIGQMAAGITHEINTPLTYIKGNIEMSRYDLEDMPDNEFKQRLLDDNEKVMNGINRMGLIVESMREVSQVTPSVKHSENIYGTIVTVLRMTHNRSKQITPIYINNELFVLENSDKSKHQYMALVNKQKIEQVWTILLNNAFDELIKIEPYEKRRVDINIKEKDNELHVEIRDNAGGIPHDIIDKIFEPFVS
ncbi:MAG: PAS domain S-box protein, partial [Campylobacterota bacterium]|nr:PAS domain S-box protein [Campylobacterota bacterium]